MGLSTPAVEAGPQASMVGPRMRALGRQLPAQWTLSVYPDAAEAGGCFTSARRHVWVPAGAGRDRERAGQEAARRARRKLRLYCAANGLNRFGTLTYGPPRCTDSAQLRSHVGLFFRELRLGLGARPLPYVWVPEMHKDGLHFHVHFAVGRFVPYRLIKRTWGRGIVNIKLLGDLPVGSGRRDEARVAAGYLAKYVGKTFTDPSVRVPGMHRYDCAQNFQPVVKRLTGRTAADVLGQASQLLGGPPVRQWSSLEVEDWDKPPAIWAQWN